MRKLFLEQEQFNEYLDEYSNKILSCINTKSPYAKHVEAFLEKVCLAENSFYVLSEVVVENSGVEYAANIEKIKYLEMEKLQKILDAAVKKIWDTKIKPALASKKNYQIASNYWVLVNRLSKSFYQTVLQKMNATKRLGGEDVKNYKTNVMYGVKEPSGGKFFVPQLLYKLKNQFVDEESRKKFIDFVTDEISDDKTIDYQQVMRFFKNNPNLLKTESVQKNSNLLESFKLMLMGNFTPEWLVKNIESCISFYGLPFEEAVAHANEFGKQKTLFEAKSNLDKVFGDEQKRTKNLIALANTFNDEIQNSNLAAGIKDFVKNVLQKKIKQDPKVIFNTLFPDKFMISKKDDEVRYSKNMRIQADRILRKVMVDLGFNVDEIIHAINSEDFKSIFTVLKEKYKKLPNATKKIARNVLAKYLISKKNEIAGIAQPADDDDSNEYSKIKPGKPDPIEDNTDSDDEYDDLDHDNYDDYDDDDDDDDVESFKNKNSTKSSVGKLLAGLSVGAAIAGLVIFGIHGLAGKPPSQNELEKAATVLVDEISSSSSSPDSNSGSNPTTGGEDGNKKIEPKTQPKEETKKAENPSKNSAKPWPYFPKPTENKSDNSTNTPPTAQSEAPQANIPIEKLVANKAYLNKRGYLGQPNLVVYQQGADGQQWVKSVDNLGKTELLGKLISNNNLVKLVNRAKELGIGFNPKNYSFEWEDSNGVFKSAHADSLNIRALESEAAKLNAKPVPKASYGDPFELSPKRDYMDNEEKSNNMPNANPMQFLADNPGKGMELVKNGFENVDNITAQALARSPNSLDYDGFAKLLKNGNNSKLTNALIQTQMDILKGGHTVTPYNIQQAEKNYNSGNAASSSSAAEPQKTSQAAVPQPEVKQDSTPQQPQNATSTSDNKEDMAATVQRKLDRGEDASSIINGLGDNVDAKTAKTIIKSGKINSQQDAVRLSGKINPYQIDAEIASEINKLAGYKHVLPNMDIIKNSIKNGMSPYDIISIYSKFTNKSVLNDRDEAKYPIELHWANTNDLWTGFEHLSKTEKVYGWAKRLAGKLIMNQYGGIDNLSNLQDNVYTNVAAGLALNKVISQQEAQVLMKNANKILDDNVKTQLQKIANGEVQSLKEHRSFRSFLESRI